MAIEYWLLQVGNCRRHAGFNNRLIEFEQTIVKFGNQLTSFD